MLLSRTQYTLHKNRIKETVSSLAEIPKSMSIMFDTHYSIRSAKRFDND